MNQKYLDALRRALEQADGLDRVFAHHITNKAGKYIVFCANKEHMDEMISHVPEWFAKVNLDVAVYEAYSDDPNTDKAFADFKKDENNRLKLLFCIDMLNEGVHVEGISGVILFRPTISPIIYKQQIGRALTAGDNAMPLILDVVNNFEGLCSISGLQDEMQEAVHRLYANGEGDKIITERFEIIEQVHDCRVLFERLQTSLSSSWEQYFSEASIYYAEHGDLNVPKRYKTPTGLNLGEWLMTQRKVRTGQKAGNLSEQQIDRLDNIGMDWEKRNDSAWKHGLEEAQKYREQFGNLQVPAKYRTKDGYMLGSWIINARQNRILGRLNKKQITQLDDLDMTWKVFDVRWEQGYALAAAYGLRTINVLTGFKFIGEQIGKLEKQGKADSYVFGFEESYGYLTGSYVRDKDGVDGAYMICEMFSYYATKGISLLDKLDELYKTYGYCLNTLHSYEFDGSAGFAKMQNIMQAFRGNIKKFGGKNVVKLLDYAPGLDGLPKSDVLKFLLEDNCSIVVRPSGTEPKLKTYISVSAENKEAAEKVEAEIRKSAEEYLK